MKKIYLSLLSSTVLSLGLSAQLSLTKAAFEPVIGDITSTVDYDSTGVIPKSSGANQTWNFTSSIIQTSAAASSTMVAASSVPASSMFPGATIAEWDGSSYTFYKGTSTEFDVLGFTDNSGTMLTYTPNPMTMLKWPTSYGDSYSDTYSGSFSGVGLSASSSGSQTITASGTGILMLPGGLSYSNMLQVKIAQSMTTTITVPISTISIDNSISYLYFHSSSKTPLVSINYDNGKFSNMSLDKKVAVGITDYNFDASFSIYPNPAKTHFNVSLGNENSHDCTVQIYSITGQLIKAENLGNSSKIEALISLQDMSPGVYMVKTQLGQKNSTRRLVIQ